SGRKTSIVLPMSGWKSCWLLPLNSSRLQTKKITSRPFHSFWRSLKIVILKIESKSTSFCSCCRRQSRSFYLFIQALTLIRLLKGRYASLKCVLTSLISRTSKCSFELRTLCLNSSSTPPHQICSHFSLLPVVGHICT